MLTNTRLRLVSLILLQGSLDNKLTTYEWNDETMYVKFNDLEKKKFQAENTFSYWRLEVWYQQIYQHGGYIADSQNIYRFFNRLSEEAWI
ncbi:hypothetical protein chiPu_0007938 [Chiloscyllium punctatum]|uniref:MHC class I-like antigen recognition-like domain-containing protein n=1 Tax=Chiloscyllium punctatum TaxID=137246 RepID=A0A401SGE6_CHIPU|nr:hypothetical protein [Chiloscyllium punctatum]